MIGGGTPLRPGEISLAHHGVLFLDELAEYRRNVLEVLRQPLEEGVVRLARARAAVRYPARFLLVAAMNPCPCGYYGDGSDRCLCDPGAVLRYRVTNPGPRAVDVTVVGSLTNPIGLAGRDDLHFPRFEGRPAMAGRDEDGLHGLWGTTDLAPDDVRFGTVALVTTAALMHPGEPWAANSHAFRVFGNDELHVFENAGIASGARAIVHYKSASSTPRSRSSTTPTCPCSSTFPKSCRTRPMCRSPVLCRRGTTPPRRPRSMRRAACERHGSAPTR